MKAGKYISELLYQHDSVILPGFGLFTTRYVPAKFIPEKKIVEAPAKIADYSPGPKDGDTPLPAYMAEKEGTTIEEVNEFLDGMVRDIKQSLQEGKRIEIERIGRFKLDEKGNTEFEPDQSVNYLDEATNVPEVSAQSEREQVRPVKEQIQPVTKPEPEKKEASPVRAYATRQETGQTYQQTQGQSVSKTEVKAKPRDIQTHTPEPMKQQDTTNDSPSAYRWLAYILGPLLLLLVLFFAYNHYIAQRETPRPIEVMVEPLADIKPPEIVEEPVVTPAEPVRREYYLVVGSYRNPLKAEQQAQRLRRQGIHNAQVFMETPANYHRVCYGHYETLSAAQRQKAQLPADLRENAWIMRR